MPDRPDEAKEFVEYMTVGEARRRLGVSKPKMAQLIREGLLSTITSPLDRRVKLVRVLEVEALATGWSKGERSAPPAVSRHAKSSGVDEATP